jgi:nicotinamidase/pyrazinamidase
VKIDLLIIDPQYDFCNPKGNLYVAGAEDDMKRLSTMIKKGKAKINNIHSTLDQHHIIDTLVQNRL